MRQECKYNPITDIQRVEQCGFVDLAAANAASSIPSDLSASELQYNDIDDPNGIAGRPSDAFEAAQMAKATVDYVPPTKQE